MSNPFEKLPMPPSEEESKKIDIDEDKLEKNSGDKEDEGLKEIKEMETEAEAEEKIESVLVEQEKIADVEEQISIRNLPEQEASLFGRAKEKLKKNLRNAVFFGVMATSLLGAGCKEKSPERGASDKPAAVHVGKEEKKIIIERNGRKIVTTERAQGTLEEGRRKAQRIMEQQREIVNREMEIMDQMSSENYVKYKIAIIDRQIKTLEDGNENGAWNKEINEREKERAELERILKTGKSEDYARTQRQGFEGWSKTEEKLQTKRMRKEEKEVKKPESRYDNKVVEGPDLTHLDPTLR